MSHKVNKYHSFEQFLEHKSPDLKWLVDNLGMTIIQKGGGLTLLLPPKKFIDSLMKLYQEDKKELEKYPEEVQALRDEGIDEDELGENLAYKFIASLIITRFYPTPESFLNSSIVNKLYQVYKVKDVKGDKVHLDIGTLTSNPAKFMKNIGKRNNKLVVWNLEGTPSILTPKFERKGVQGGHGGVKPKHKIRPYLWKKVIEDTCESLYIRRFDQPGMDMKFIVSMMTYLEEVDPNKYAQAQLFLDYCPLISFIFIFSDCELITDDILYDWYTTELFYVVPNCVERFKNFFPNAGVDREELKKYYDDLINIDLNSLYKNFMEDGKYAEVEVVDPEILREAYQNNVTYKMNQDVLRLHIFRAYNDLIMAENCIEQNVIYFFDTVKLKMCQIKNSRLSIFRRNAWDRLFGGVDPAKIFVETNEFLYFQDGCYGLREEHLAKITLCPDNVRAVKFVRRYLVSMDKNDIPEDLKSILK